VMRCPGVIPAGTTCDVPITTPDLYPTFLDMLGIEPDPAQLLDGASLSSLLRGQSDSLARGPIFWYYPLLQGHFLGGRSGDAIRKGDYKLIEHFDYPADELYNLASDLGETQNLADEMPELVAQLKSELAQWRTSVNVPVPSPYTT
jgi:arylsulfatase A-like enzyme